MSREHCLRKESLLQLPHEVVEGILESVAVKSLLRFKAVSKLWRSTIESQCFQGRHFTHRQRSGDPDVLMVSVTTHLDIDTIRTLVLGSSSSVKIPFPWEETTDKNFYLVSHNSCDGLLCLYNPYKAFVVNPPLDGIGLFLLVTFKDPMIIKFSSTVSTDSLGLDSVKTYSRAHIYKLVWLYNSFDLGLENATTCQVFDFTTNASYRVLAPVNPVFVDGSLHWLADCLETKVVSFDLHTEAFQVISKAPFFKSSYRYGMVMCNLDNRLCVSEMKRPHQVIWSFNSNNKTWDKMYSIELDLTLALHGIPRFTCYPLVPLAILKKKKLLFYDRMRCRQLFTRDSETKRDEVAFSGEFIGVYVCYFPSLISIL